MKKNNIQLLSKIRLTSFTKINLLLVFFAIFFVNIATSTEENNEANYTENLPTITSFVVDNDLPDPSSDIKFDIVIDSLASVDATIDATVDYYISLDTDISSDDIHLGSQKLSFTPNILSIARIVRMVITNELNQQFYIGSCVASRLEQTKKLHCSDAILIDPVVGATIPISVNIDAIDWLHDVQLTEI